MRSVGGKSRDWRTSGRMLAALPPSDMSRPSEAVRRDWEDVGCYDPLWGVLSMPAGKFNAWDREEFFRTGKQRIDTLMEAVASLDVDRPQRRDNALDFGCGVGRLTRPLSDHFERVVGLDVSHAMVERARDLNAEFAGCEFVANDADDLGIFEDESFDFIYTQIVLQHMANAATIKAFVAEFVRTLSPDGLLVFQLLTHIPPYSRLRLRHRAYRGLRQIGVPPRLLHERMHLMPFRVTHVPEPEITALLHRLGSQTVRIEREHLAHSGIDSATFFVVR